MGKELSLADLSDLEEIRNLKARYCRFLDTKNWIEYGNLFTADAKMDCREETVGDLPPPPDVFGGDNIREQVSSLVHPARTVHQVHAPEIELLGNGKARGVWAMEDWVSFPPGSEAPFTSMNGFGHYHETYEKHDGRWYIASLKLTRLQRFFT